MEKRNNSQVNGTPPSANQTITKNLVLKDRFETAQFLLKKIKFNIQNGTPLENDTIDFIRCNAVVDKYLTYLNVEARNDHRLLKKWKKWLSDERIIESSEQDLSELMSDSKIYLALVDDVGTIKPLDTTYLPKIYDEIRKRRDAFLQPNSRIFHFEPCGIYRGFFLIRCCDKYSKNVFRRCIAQLRSLYNRISFIRATRISKILENAAATGSVATNADQPSHSFTNLNSKPNKTNQQFEGFQLSINYGVPDFEDMQEKSPFSGFLNEKNSLELKEHTQPFPSTPTSLTREQRRRERKARREMLRIAKNIDNLNKEIGLQQSEFNHCTPSKSTMLANATINNSLKHNKMEFGFETWGNCPRESGYFDSENRQIQMADKMSSCLWNSDSAYKKTKENFRSSSSAPQSFSNSFNDTDSRMDRTSKFPLLNPNEDSFINTRNFYSSNHRSENHFSSEMEQINELPQNVNNYCKPKEQSFNESIHSFGNKTGSSSNCKRFLHPELEMFSYNTCHVPESFDEIQSNSATIGQISENYKFFLRPNSRVESYEQKMNSGLNLSSFGQWRNDRKISEATANLIRSNNEKGCYQSYNSFEEEFPTKVLNSKNDFSGKECAQETKEPMIPQSPTALLKRRSEILRKTATNERVTEVFTLSDDTDIEEIKTIEMKNEIYKNKLKDKKCSSEQNSTTTPRFKSKQSPWNSTSTAQRHIKTSNRPESSVRIASNQLNISQAPLDTKDRYGFMPNTCNAEFEIAIIDRNKADFKISNKDWLEIEKNFLEQLAEEMHKRNNTNIGMFDGIYWRYGIKIIKCGNKESLNFFRRFIQKQYNTKYHAIPVNDMDFDK